MRKHFAFLSPIAFAAGVCILLPFAQHALVALGSLRRPMSCDCFGPEDAAVRVVYLHGLDTPGPSWVEVQNRARLRALAHVLRARIALPRSRFPWSQRRSAGIERSLAIINGGAATCFRDRSSFGLIGFSDGGNFANELFLQCRPSAPLWIVSIGSEGIVPRSSPQLSGCGRLRLIAGRHEPLFAISRGLARQLARHGADVRFIEHPGPHELPFDQTLAAVAEVAGTNAN